MHAQMAEAATAQLSFSIDADTSIHGDEPLGTVNPLKAGRLPENPHSFALLKASALTPASIQRELRALGWSEFVLCDAQLVTYCAAEGSHGSVSIDSTATTTVQVVAQAMAVQWNEQYANALYAAPGVAWTEGRVLESTVASTRLLRNWNMSAEGWHSVSIRLAVRAWLRGVDNAGVMLQVSPHTVMSSPWLRVASREAKPTIQPYMTVVLGNSVASCPNSIEDSTLVPEPLSSPSPSPTPAVERGHAGLDRTPIGDLGELESIMVLVGGIGLVGMSVFALRYACNKRRAATRRRRATTPIDAIVLPAHSPAAGQAGAIQRAFPAMAATPAMALPGQAQVYTNVMYHPYQAPPGAVRSPAQDISPQDARRNPRTSTALGGRSPRSTPGLVESPVHAFAHVSRAAPYATIAPQPAFAASPAATAAIPRQLHTTTLSDCVEGAHSMEDPAASTAS